MSETSNHSSANCVFSYEQGYSAEIGVRNLKI